MPYIPGTFVGAFECNPQFDAALYAFNLCAQFLCDYEEAFTSVSDDEIVCAATDTDYNNLVTNLLYVMGFVALVMPFNRAVYPLPYFGGVIVET